MARIGVKGKNDKPRPVKVLLSSSLNVYQVIRKAKNLQTSDKHRAVFIAPDRSPEECIAQRASVLELQQKRKDEPSKKHFLKGRMVCTSDVPVK